MSFLTIRAGGEPVKFNEPLQFSAGERHVQIDSDLTRENNYEVTARVTNSNELMDLCLTLDAIYQGNPRSEVVLQLPYFPYSRQDRVCAEGQAFSMSFVLGMLEMAHPMLEIVTWDLHSAALASELGEVVGPHTLIPKNASLHNRLSGSNPVLVQPDKGAQNRCLVMNTLLPYFKAGEMAVGDKVRDPMTGWISSYSLSGTDVKGRTCFIADDICDGGMTFSYLAAELKAAGAKEVILYVTHGIFSKSLAPLYESGIDKIYSTNSMASAVNILPMESITFYDYFNK